MQNLPFENTHTARAFYYEFGLNSRRGGGGKRNDTPWQSFCTFVGKLWAATSTESTFGGAGYCHRARGVLF